MFKESNARGMIAAHQQQFEGYARQHRKKADDAMSTIDYRNQAMEKAKVNSALALGALDLLADPTYHDLAMRTAAGPEVFHYPVEDDTNATDATFINDVIVYLNAVARLDRWKSRLFYGKDKIVIDNAITPVIQDNWSLGNIPNPQIIHAILGIATEGGELVEDLVKLANPIGTAEIDPIADNIKRECGDVDWYQELLAKSMRFAVEDVREMNIARLAKRYPDKFSEAAAIARADEQVDGEPVLHHPV